MARYMLDMPAVLWSHSRQSFTISGTQFPGGMNHPIHAGKPLKISAVCLNLNLKRWSNTMNRILIASAIATSLFAAPAFADCAADLAKAQDKLKTAKLDDAATASVKDLVAKATDAASKKNEAACAASVAELVKLIPAK
jgi:hypothetical protein